MPVQLPHLFRRAHIVRGVGHPHPVRIVDRLAGADAQQHVVSVRLLAFGVVDVVAGDQWHVHLTSERNHFAVRRIKFGDVVTL